MVDFKTARVPSSVSSIYAGTKSYSSPASSSLDKPAGTLTGKSITDIKATGQAAQTLLSQVPRNLSPAERSYFYAQQLKTTETFAQTEARLQQILGQKSASTPYTPTTEDFIVQGVAGVAGVAQQPEYQDLTRGGTQNWLGDLAKNPLVILGAVAAGYLLLRGRK